MKKHFGCLLILFLTFTQITFPMTAESLRQNFHNQVRQMSFSEVKQAFSLTIEIAKIQRTLSNKKLDIYDKKINQIFIPTLTKKHLKIHLKKYRPKPIAPPEHLSDDLKEFFSTLPLHLQKTIKNKLNDREQRKLLTTLSEYDAKLVLKLRATIQDLLPRDKEYSFLHASDKDKQKAIKHLKAVPGNLGDEFEEDEEKDRIGLPETIVAPVAAYQQALREDFVSKLTATFKPAIKQLKGIKNLDEELTTKLKTLSKAQLKTVLAELFKIDHKLRIELTGASALFKRKRETLRSDQLAAFKQKITQTSEERIKTMFKRIKRKMLDLPDDVQTVLSDHISKLKEEHREKFKKALKAFKKYVEERGPPKAPVTRRPERRDVSEAARPGVPATAAGKPLTEKEKVGLYTQEFKNTLKTFEQSFLKKVSATVTKLLRQHIAFFQITPNTKDADKYYTEFIEPDYEKALKVEITILKNKVAKATNEMKTKLKDITPATRQSFSAILDVLVETFIKDISKKVKATPYLKNKIAKKRVAHTEGAVLEPIKKYNTTTKIAIEEELKQYKDYLAKVTRQSTKVRYARMYLFIKHLLEEISDNIKNRLQEEYLTFTQSLKVSAEESLQKKILAKTKIEKQKTEKNLIILILEGLGQDLRPAEGVGRAPDRGLLKYWDETKGWLWDKVRRAKEVLVGSQKLKEIKAKIDKAYKSQLLPMLRRIFALSDDFLDSYARLLRESETKIKKRYQEEHGTAAEGEEAAAVPEITPTYLKAKLLDYLTFNLAIDLGSEIDKILRPIYSEMASLGPVEEFEIEKHIVSRLEDAHHAVYQRIFNHYSATIHPHDIFDEPEVVEEKGMLGKAWDWVWS